MDAKQFLSEQWDQSVVPVLTEYIKIPNQSPEFDPEWETNGLLLKAMHLLVDWAKQQPLQGVTFELLEEKGRTPFLYMDVAPFDGTKPTPTSDEKQPVVLMYGHMDKQPPLEPWAEGLGPYKPVLKNGRLYGRGGADDGYAICASMLSLIAVQKQGKPHTRTCIVIEASEESSETDLDYWIEKLKPRFGNVTLVVCLDSGALTYDRMWLTSSLRGVTSLFVKAEMLTEGIHSGIGGGAVCDTFRLQRMLLDRIEDSATGEVKVPEAHCTIPDSVRRHMAALNEIPYDEFIAQYPLVKGGKPEPGDNIELALRTTWMPSVTVTGAGGLPALEHAGNVLRPSTSLKLSLRMPPLVKCSEAATAFKAKLLKDPPYGAHVEVTGDDAYDGWAAPQLEPWLEQCLTQASVEAFGKPFASVGLGGSIPFMGMLGEMFPQAQFVVTGVLGPHSNAHGPNEFLDVAFGKGINLCVTRVISAHHAHSFAGNQ
jgi:acetylornithine deacetylase/succinyl-diaminopimelate desuccinylase-like protein